MTRRDGWRSVYMQSMCHVLEIQNFLGRNGIEEGQPQHDDLELRGFAKEQVQEKSAK